MPRTIEPEDDWEDDEESEWSPDEEDGNDWSEGDDEDETIPCPHCGKDVYEGAEQCPNCGRYLSEEDKPPEIKPTWIVVGALVCVAIVILWIWKG